jgi:hypothetical protein
MFKDAQTFLGTLLNNEVPDMRKEVLKYLDDNDFMRACLLSNSTVTANLHELIKRHNNAVRQTNEALKKKQALPMDGDSNEEIVKRARLQMFLCSKANMMRS